MVAHDPRIRAHFIGGVVWVTVGEEAAGPDLASKLVSTARLFDAAAADVNDPLAAGGVLARALADRPVLLVVDDVWTSEQVEPFLIGGERVVRLFTTRQHGVLPVGAARVRVDQMAETEARELLTAGLPVLPAGLVADALRMTGRWPVLLALVHGALGDAPPRRRRVWWCGRGRRFGCRCCSRTVEIVFTTEHDARAYALDRSRDWRVLAVSVTRYVIAELGTRHPVAWYMNGAEQPRRAPRPGRLYPTDEL